MCKNKKLKIDNKPTHAQLAQALGVSPRHIATLAAGGMPTDSIEAAKAWRGSSKAAVDELRAARIRLVEQQAEAAQIQNSVRRGELVSADEVRESAVRLGSTFRAGLMALTNGLPPLLSGLDEVAISKVLKTEFIELLSSLADQTNPAWSASTADILRAAWSLATEAERKQFLANIR
jgi:phage terminase Nu1 subunit (DNA packaging protein)